MQEKDDNTKPADEENKPLINSEENIKTETTDNLISETNNTDKKHSKRKIGLIIGSVLLVLILLIAGWYFIWGREYFNVKMAKVPEKTKQKVTKAVETDPQLIKFITPTTGEKWLDKPVSIAKQGFFKYMPKDYYAGEGMTDYYRVGSRGENTIIMTVSPGTVANEIYLFEKSAGGIVTFINHPSSTAVYNSDYQNNLPMYSSDSIKLSNNIHYDSLSIPDQIKIDDKDSYIKSPEYATLGYLYSEASMSDKNVINETLVKKLGKSAIYKYESTSAETGLTSISYFIKTPINTRFEMDYEPLDLALKGYKWQSGFADSSDSLKAVTRGCGLPGASVTRDDSIKSSDVRVVGKSAKGLTVYEFVDANNTLLKKAYDEYYQFFKDDQNYQTVSMQDYIKEHGLIIYKDVNGQWLVYVRTKLAPGGGCAKPVIYLYPKSSQTVSVKVGADVKISDPYYNPSRGWTVFANPNGQLSLNGHTYDSLFWEGPGYGAYPEITEGTVVKKQDAVPTIKKQLAQQGLNKKEINDFVEYWQDKLPDKPYIRLTWFNTQQMNRLAPLYINPEPDTVIRVFMDSSGLDKPISIPGQSLVSTPRHGFTLVEWGGLSHKKLY